MGHTFARTLPASRSSAVSLQSVTGESRQTRVVDIGLEANRRNKHHSVTIEPINTRDNQMAKGKYRKVPNRNQG